MRTQMALILAALAGFNYVAQTYTPVAAYDLPGRGMVPNFRCKRVACNSGKCLYSDNHGPQFVVCCNSGSEPNAKKCVYAPGSNCPIVRSARPTMCQECRVIPAISCPNLWGEPCPGSAMGTAEEITWCLIEQQ